MKKILALCLVVVLAVTAVTGATLAYFTDKDADVNVMTTGNLRIIQNETDRNGEAYTDGQKLLPAVYFKNVEGELVPYNPTAGWEGPEGGATGTATGPDGETMNIYDANINNEIDKVVSVTNHGNVDAYVRTLIMIEDNSNLSDNLHIVYSDTDVAAREVVDNVKIGEDSYEVWVFTYKNALAPTKTTKASLKQVWLDPNATSEWYKLLGDDKLTIVALSQACQVEGFADAAQALDTAFGVVNETNINKWIAETNIDTEGADNTVGTVKESTTTVASKLAG